MPSRATKAKAMRKHDKKKSYKSFMLINHKWGSRGFSCEEFMLYLHKPNKIY